MKIPYVLAFTSVLLMGCSTTTEQPIVEEPVEEVVISNELVIAPFAFTFPAGWSAEEEGNGMVISVPDATYEVQLVMTLEADGAEPIEGTEMMATEENIQIYNIGCGGAYYCGNLMFDGQSYNYAFQVESTEPVPENLDGIWTPSIDVTQEDLADFIGTVHLAK